MSKAVNTLDRKVLIDELQEALEPDELHLAKILLNVELSVRNGNY